MKRVLVAGSTGYLGGPEIMSFREIARLAFDVLGKTPRITSVPLSLTKGIVEVTKVVKRHQGELLAFFTDALSRNSVAPPFGTHRLEDHFVKVAAERERQ